MNWLPLRSISDVEALIEASNDKPCLLLKHSTTCSISSIAKHRLERQWAAEHEGSVLPYYLDLLSYRAVSNFIAEQFGVHHESPQVLLIHHGACIYDASHLQISLDAVLEQLQLS